ncbi:MAG: fatty acid desaturase [Pseudomonadales bacterium]
MANTKLFKHPDTLLYSGGATLYAVIAYLTGWLGLFHSSAWVNAAATLMLAHGMIIASYLLHDCAHNAVFRTNKNNARLGTFLCWLNGASYGTYEDVRYKHFRHHVDNDDVVWFDYDTFFNRHPLLTKVVHGLEWLYIPAHDLIMHTIMVFTSYVIPQRRDQRLRNTLVILVRGAVFSLIALLSIKAALLYMLAYLIMMTVLRFMDSVQHDYGYRTVLFEGEPSEHKGDSEWEREHTFSNIISWRWEWPNWLVLNFGYHNAHHAKPTTPWFRLPKLHRELFGDDPDKVARLWPQLRTFHRSRVARVIDYKNQVPDAKGRYYLQNLQQGESIMGGNAASFLTSF